MYQMLIPAADISDKLHGYTASINIGVNILIVLSDRPSLAREERMDGKVGLQKGFASSAEHLIVCSHNDLDLDRLIPEMSLPARLH